MRSLIAGINGFAGSHLADLLVSKNEEVFGLARNPENDENIRHHKGRVRVFPGDVRSFDDVKRVLEAVRPRRVYHLASTSFVPEFSRDWQASFETVFFGVRNMLEAVKQAGLETRVLWVGSSEEYGPPDPGDEPIAETRPLKPVSLYGASKAAADILAGSYARRDKLDVVLARPFNHVGPRQDGRFVAASFARQVALIEAGAPPVLKVGNLEAQRDFADARDTVRAYRAIMERGTAGEVYNVCSGRSISIQAMLDGLLKLVSVPVRVEIDPERYRPEPRASFYGDGSKLTRETGWRPEISLETTLRDLLDYWREKIKKG